jgi:hypothetical protein
VDTAKKVGLTLFFVAWFFLALTLFVLARIWQAQQVSTSDFLFILLLLLSGTVFASRYIGRKLGLQRRGRLIMALVIVSIFLLFFAPAVQKIPSPQGGTGVTCKGNICSDVTQWGSATDYYYCWGGSYSYDTIDGLVLGIETGCPLLM